ncbi:hypothetical protein JYT29_01865 [Nitrospina gracilis]|nr:hypothetical protein [Nitrospina gracilis]
MGELKKTGKPLIYKNISEKIPIPKDQPFLNDKLDREGMADNLSANVIKALLRVRGNKKST